MVITQETTLPLGGAGLLLPVQRRSVPRGASSASGGEGGAGGAGEKQAATEKTKENTSQRMRERV